MKLERGFYSRLRSFCGASEEQVHQIRRVIERLDLEPCPTTRSWVESCYHTPGEQAIALAAIDEILGNYGIAAEELRPGQWLEYINAGDAYTPTVVLWRGILRVTDWGAIVERLHHG